MFCQKSLHRMRCMSALFWWSCQSQWPMSAAFWIAPIVSMEECSSLTQNLKQIHCSIHLVILNVMVTQYTGSLGGVYCSYWPQWSHHCSHMHSSPLSLAARLHRCHANVPIILTVAGLFLDRIHIHSFSTGDIYLAYLDVHCIQCCSYSM